MTVPDGVVFRELPFCGVFVDVRRGGVYRISRTATAVVRVALRGPLVPGPYEELVGHVDVAPDSDAARGLIERLVATGLLRRAEVAA